MLIVTSMLERYFPDLSRIVDLPLRVAYLFEYNLLLCSLIFRKTSVMNIISSHRLENKENRKKKHQHGKGNIHWYSDIVTNYKFHNITIKLHKSV